MKNIATKLAKYLLEIKAVKLSPESPFTWASGLKSPIYCDNRQILSYPEIRNFVKESFATIIKEHFPNTEYIAGVATGAIAIGVLTADLLELPFVYVRPKAKDHGLKNRIEGKIEPGKNVVVIEDLVSTGKSSLEAVKALREVEANILGMTSIFTYELEIAKQNFEQENCKLIPLTDYNTLLNEAIKEGYINNSDLESLQNWKKDPENWYKTIIKE
jgi:orotate phosphoribosyltransferase